MTDRSAHPTADRAPAAGAARRRGAVAGAGAGALDDLLGAAVAGAGLDRDRDRPVPRGLLARAVAVAAADRARDRSRRLLPARGGGVCAAAGAAAAEPARRPAPARSQFRAAASAGDRDRRRDRGPDRAIRIRVALWRAHVERALRAAKTLKAGVPAPRLAVRDPFALRALVAVLVVATFFAAGGERMKRVAAAFDWQGVMRAGQFPHRRLGRRRRPIPAGRR